MLPDSEPQAWGPLQLSSQYAEVSGRPIFADEKKLEPQTLRGTTQDGMLNL